MKYYTQFESVEVETSSDISLFQQFRCSEGVAHIIGTQG